MEKNTVSQLQMPRLGDDSPREPQVLRVSYNLCYEHANKMAQEVRGLIAKRAKRVVLDLTDVSIIDSSGLRSLLQARKACKDAGTELIIGRASECVARIIGMSRLGAAFGMPDRVFEASAGDALSGLDMERTNWNVQELVADSDPSVISGLRETIVRAATEAGADGETLCDIQIAAGEALTNAYRHGSPNKGLDKIQVKCLSCPGALVVEILDQGLPFDPNGTTEPDPREMRDHGMGIFLMRQAMDVVEFATDCPGNRVRMVKWLGRDGEDAPCG